MKEISLTSILISGKNRVFGVKVLAFDLIALREDIVSDSVCVAP